MANEKKEHLSHSKRKFIKKAALSSAFVIPTLQTFAIKDLHACHSGSTGDGTWKPPQGWWMG